MRRTQVLLDEVTYQAVKREAQARDISMSELLRQVLRQQLGPKLKERRDVRDLAFVSLGRSNQLPGDRSYPISERHDEALVEDFGK
jgi:hypothetical protein